MASCYSQNQARSSVRYRTSSLRPRNRPSRIVTLLALRKLAVRTHTDRSTVPRLVTHGYGNDVKLLAPANLLSLQNGSDGSCSRDDAPPAFKKGGAEWHLALLVLQWSIIADDRSSPLYVRPPSSPVWSSQAGQDRPPLGDGAAFSRLMGMGRSVSWRVLRAFLRAFRIVDSRLVLPGL